MACYRSREPQDRDNHANLAVAQRFTRNVHSSARHRVAAHIGRAFTCYKGNCYLFTSFLRLRKVSDENESQCPAKPNGRPAAIGCGISHDEIRGLDALERELGDVGIARPHKLYGITRWHPRRPWIPRRALRSDDADAGEPRCRQIIPPSPRLHYTRKSIKSNI